MGRPPLPIGSHGNIRFSAYPPPAGDRYRAKCKVRDLDGRTREATATGKTMAAARRALQQSLSDRSGPVAEALAPVTRFKVVAPLWLEEIRRLRAGTSYDTYRRHLHNRILPALGELQLRECTVPVVHRYLRALEAELGPNTVRSCRTVLSGVLAFAVQQGALPTNPVRDAGRIEGGGTAARALTREERAQLLELVDGNARAVADDLPDLIRFMLGTGVRVGEALALRWGQVDLDAREALIGPTLGRVTGKGLIVNEGGKKGRRDNPSSGWRLVPLPDFVVLMLSMRFAPDVDVRAPVFPNTLGSWRDPQNTQRSIRKARDAAGFGWFTTHVCRKTAITIMDEQQLTAREIAGHVGHARPSITMDVYMDLRSRGRSTADALDSAMRSGGVERT